jgi:hypothetical protein
MRNSPIATLLVLILAVTLTVLSSTIAIADIDPASDVLETQDTFLPYQPKTCTKLANSLRDLTKKTRKAGYPIKIAVIGSPPDLGGATQFTGLPQDYAKFLDGELRVYAPDFGKIVLASQPLLVVMPNGFAYEPRNARFSRLLKGVLIPRNARSNELVRAALVAVPKLAQAAGHPVPASSVSLSGCSGSSDSSALLLGGGAALLVLVLGGAGFAFKRLRSTRAAPR